VLSPDRTTLAFFRVPGGALDAPEEIQMEVVGSGADVQIHFGPYGLHFLKPCTLTISIPRSALPDGELGGYLLNSDGTVTEVPHRIRTLGSRVYITLAISHFSIYSPSDGEGGAHDGEGGNEYDPYANGAPIP